MKATVSGDDIFILLDDAGGCAAPGQRLSLYDPAAAVAARAPTHSPSDLPSNSLSSSPSRSRLYRGWRQTLACRPGENLASFFQGIDAALAEGLHVVGLFDYEFGYVLQRLPFAPAADADVYANVNVNVNAAAPAGTGTGTDRPCASALLFERCDQLEPQQVAGWLAEQAQASPYAVTGQQAALGEAEFADAVATIHRLIEAGETYQVNFTFPLRFHVHGNLFALYAALRARQPVPYGALMLLPDGSSVLSMSPELFVSLQDGQLACRPMKGTAAASGDPIRDAQRADALRHSQKERSENLMIVDLLRNDLGRIAVTGSVQVTDLFSVEHYGAVLQMTSGVTATVRDTVGLQQVSEALYPCGSITGAPKRHTMQVLQNLERWPRRLYTGAIGWFEPPAAGRTLGNFMLSVPIRTLLLDAPEANERRRGEMGVGAGIVYDSEAQAEYQECLLKAQFLTGMAPGFELFETMQATRDGCPYLERHLARLSSSAAQLGFACDTDRIRSQVQASCAALWPGTWYRLRLSLDPAGRVQLHSASVMPVQEPVGLLLSPIAMRSDDPLLAHKTTLRRVYDEAWQAAERAGAFDSLFFNERGELTEGGRSNVLVKLAGRWFTPPLSAGLLPGVMRQVVLADSALELSERHLRREDLLAADEIRVCNALRGVLAARLVGTAAT